ncbi:PRP3-domain-containing protein [Mytilinidion resinicola]|uniref:PRP3-domain-containing protein n=1 Tax=Mytilinidion resinicola TaxID=574789 RepID=A0A6A6Y593_9PEZI|nr:PRP3-domain-containing protein [Mytilinidion resinicola]KAF2803194.1 PRP3-domain-containing protein [Mytilinidion resinicola]
MPEKRPYPDDNGARNDSKRPRSNNASPAPATSEKMRAALAAKAKVDAQLAAKREAGVADARARAAAIAAKFGRPAPGQPLPAATPSPSTNGHSTAPAGQSSAEDKNAALRAQLAQVLARKPESTATPPQRPPPPPAHARPQHSPPEVEDVSQRARGGLNVGLHPSLMGEMKQDSKARGKPMAPKFATTMANRRGESPAADEEKEEKNPYLDSSEKAGPDRTRLPRKIVMNQKGKYIEQAARLRRQEEMEALKRRIAAETRKKQLEESNEKGFLIPEPPACEWWDEILLDATDYAVLNDPAKLKFNNDDSIVTVYVQHPVEIRPPQEKLVIPVKPMYLTKTETKKVRRQRRAAENKEKQAKIRLGLEPPPPPKVKRGNMMRVLGEQAIADPTAIEALVEKQIRERQEAHEEANEARRLSKDQRHEKLSAQQAADAAKGMHLCVYKINNLSYGKHRFQVDKNAKDNALTGITILNPNFSLVIVEGGSKSCDLYKKLMLHRIKWTENAMPNSVREGNKEAEVAWLNSVDEQGQLKDFSQNKCTLIWEGEEKQRAFRKWGSRVCETDGEAKEVLTRAKMDSFWALAKSVA